MINYFFELSAGLKIVYNNFFIVGEKYPNKYLDIIVESVRPPKFIIGQDEFRILMVWKNSYFKFYVFLDWCCDVLFDWIETAHR